MSTPPRQGVRCRALYTVPDFQDSTGALLAGEKKLALAWLAFSYLPQDLLVQGARRIGEALRGRS